MQLSNLFTLLVGAAATFQGARAAPVATPRSGVFELTEICNSSTLPDTLLTPLSRNYAACRQRIEENPRLFGGRTATGKEALCIQQAGVDAAFTHALKDRPSEIPVVREGLHRLAGSRATNPLPSPAVADHSLRALRQINFHDYKHSRSTQYANQLQQQVDVLRTHIPPAQRGSLEDAHREALLPACRDAWNLHLSQWVRTEIAERSTLVTMREVGNPESISHAQADVLRADLAATRFGNTAMKRRMHEDALVALVAREH